MPLQIYPDEAELHKKLIDLARGLLWPIVEKPMRVPEQSEMGGKKIEQSEMVGEKTEQFELVGDGPPPANIFVPPLESMLRRPC